MLSYDAVKVKYNVIFILWHNVLFLWIAKFINIIIIFNPNTFGIWNFEYCFFVNIFNPLNFDEKHKCQFYQFSAQIRSKDSRVITIETISVSYQNSHMPFLRNQFLTELLKIKTLDLWTRLWLTFWSLLAVKILSKISRTGKDSRIPSDSVGDNLYINDQRVLSAIKELYPSIFPYKNQIFFESTKKVASGRTLFERARHDNKRKFYKQLKREKYSEKSLGTPR